jgi:DNA-binding winged helix-turn-helix (wHTH) protein
MRAHAKEWVADTATRQVTRGGEVVHLSPKAFDLLMALLEERPRVVPKVELQRRLWPDTVVADANLASLVAEVRTTLGDSARRPRYIRTAHRRGYAFCGSVRMAGEPREPARAPSVSARLILGMREVALGQGEHLLGRAPEVAVWVDSAGVSRRHARIVVDGATAFLEDLGSKNGTYLNDLRVSRPRRLRDGDEIRIGAVRIVFRAFATPPSTETEAG